MRNHLIPQLQYLTPPLPIPPPHTHTHTQLSFADPHFADCPLASVSGYRDLSLTTLPHLTSLDGAAVAGRDRAAAEDSALRSALDFVTTLEQLRSRHEAEFAAIQQSRATQGRNVAAVAAKVTDRLAQLEVSAMLNCLVRERASFSP